MDKNSRNSFKPTKKRHHDLVQIEDVDPDIIEISFVQPSNFSSDELLELSSDEPSIKKYRNNSSEVERETSTLNMTKLVRHSLPATSQTSSNSRTALKNNSRFSSEARQSSTYEQMLKGPTKSIIQPGQKNNLKSKLCKNKNSDVYSSLLDNYRYLVTPKSWSVTEFVDEVKDRFIIFFHTDIIQENGFLVPVMKKSITICKETKINYTIHGLPVDTAGTILPTILDNTEKLLSILHIFDKMRVCQGLGDDLELKQSDGVIFKDSCRSWRHRNCKIVLIKATRCPICLEFRDFLLSKHSLAMNSR
ncbi:hypothetical protein QAD02_008515 [Eretmocerus hayati]|uniref:Uncharacterized protein n=1 Tax=Eretmocerus hayati TaxID=131215 RepID=A0ACC2N7B4_9HYME|nr:hypothetical protein QAD02_008515 [Eretmocerus hayati]